MYYIDYTLKILYIWHIQLNWKVSHKYVSRHSAGKIWLAEIETEFLVSLPKLKSKFDWEVWEDWPLLTLWPIFGVSLSVVDFVLVFFESVIYYAATRKAWFIDWLMVLPVHCSTAVVVRQNGTVLELKKAIQRHVILRQARIAGIRRISW